ncbi:hydrogenase maturation protease [Thiohalocapsa marina]|uniref:Hydrogenase maturation protease n=1 Tax=Thiohalocapsa marina TaxID=424902 RepID=A0A5M8FGT8_9GAMM|nr:hydrogenase maturation protease [Thiohalocapsa marina]KAA6182976.1 hydrogenase maturation protease [Thiohalocapsa marina]
MTSRRALIIGYGSPIRGDDAIGPLAADRLASLKEAGRLPDSVDIQSRHILTAELVEDMQGADLALFLDASADTAPGEVRCRPLTPDATALSTMAHFHDPRELLAWCQALYGKAPEAWLISAGGAEWGYASYQLSATAQAALEPMIGQVLEKIGVTT